jgi:hypothetical protein
MPRNAEAKAAEESTLCRTLLVESVAGAISFGRFEPERRVRKDGA